MEKNKFQKVENLNIFEIFGKYGNFEREKNQNFQIFLEKFQLV